MGKRDEEKVKRRYLIVSAAITCFIKNGVHQTGIRDIAKQAEISLGNLYNYFPSKEALVAEIAKLDGVRLEQVVNVVDSHENPFSAIEKLVDHYLDYLSKVENAFLTIEILAESLRNPVVAKQFEENRQQIIDVLATTIERGISSGAMRKQVNIDEKVKLFLDAIEGLGLRSGLAQVKPSKDERKALQEIIFKMLQTN